MNQIIYHHKDYEYKAHYSYYFRVVSVIPFRLEHLRMERNFPFFEGEVLDYIQNRGNRPSEQLEFRLRSIMSQI